MTSVRIDARVMWSLDRAATRVADRGEYNPYLFSVGPPTQIASGMVSVHVMLNRWSTTSSTHTSNPFMEIDNLIEFREHLIAALEENALSLESMTPIVDSDDKWGFALLLGDHHG